MAAGSPFPPNPHDSELTVHERTYHAFNVLLRWCMTLFAAGGAFLTLWFATRIGFLGGLLVGAIIFYLGWRFLIRHETRQPLDPWTPPRP